MAIGECCSFKGCRALRDDWQHKSCAEDARRAREANSQQIVCCEGRPQSDGFCHTVRCHPFAAARAKEGK